MRLIGWAGLVLGLGGVLVLLTPRIEASATLFADIGPFLVMGSSLCWSVGSVLARYQAGLRTNVIHADLWPPNFLCTGNRVTGLLDFDACCLGPTFADVALALMEFSMFKRDQKILIEFLLLAAGLVFEPLALLDGIILFGISWGDFHAIDAAFEDLDGGRILR